MASYKMETYHGYVCTPGDAIKLFEACRLGLLPRVSKRLSEKEKLSIRSGSVFVWDERESGMRRWTDGKSWSAGRVSGSFLTYSEIESKPGGGLRSERHGARSTTDFACGRDEAHDEGEPKGYRYKAHGLMKQSFTIVTLTGQHLHHIPYYSSSERGRLELPRPTSDPSLRAIVPPKGTYAESKLHVGGEAIPPVALTQAPMQQPYMIAPHQLHAHRPPYGHCSLPGYQWPLSPAANSPSGHSAPASHSRGTEGHGLPRRHLLHAPPPPHPAYPSSHHRHAQPPSHYNGPALPPLQESKVGPAPAYQRGLSAFRLQDSSKHNEHQASHGPLPALKSVAAAVPHQDMTAPSRNHRLSPPRSSHEKRSNGLINKSSLAALLYPASESPSKAACNGSAGRSPRLSEERCAVTEDTRALRILDRKFCV